MHVAFGVLILLLSGGPIHGQRPVSGISGTVRERGIVVPRWWGLNAAHRHLEDGAADSGGAVIVFGLLAVLQSDY